MATVTISGWRVGLNKVRLNHLLRQHTGCGLGEAKNAVDQLLAGQTLAFEFTDGRAAGEFRRSVEEVGAICAREEEESGGTVSSFTRG
jgi:ribosomal protein L7/L12